MAGRPREFDRELALRQVQAVFWAHGYEGASMADLVEATGLASARLYAAFGSKEKLFREAIELYEGEEGGFADRALAQEPTARRAVERMLREAVDVYTRPGKPLGCMVVSAATNCSTDNHAVREWLEQRRRERTASIVERVRVAVAQRELPPGTDARALGDAVAALLHGLSVQARDGIPRERLLALIAPAMTMFDHLAEANSAT
ncbi:TetR/AcrR family transcriptional regulator [Nocardia araoensis]|uniref:TetR/AcrR family transcriptional regulator n=1 Tax=Nocardia araoensis TaxID=228600 RepID=UPI0002DCEA2A|nr:TetR/AcrR family transcriptional regulator [Nocardia araoensis]